MITSPIGHRVFGRGPRGRPPALRAAALAAAAAVLLGLASCAPAVRADLDPDSRAFFDTARLVMTKEEQAIFNVLPDAAARREFIGEFWSKRDPDASTPDNEFKIEFDKRVEYANSHFREGRRGIDTDRGRVYLYLGPPEHTEYYPFIERDPRPVLWWIYYTHDLGIAFRDERSDGTYNIVEISGNLLDAIERAKLGAVFDSQGNAARFINFGLRYDAARKEIVVTIPSRRLNLKFEAGNLKGEFEFTFYHYKPDGSRDKFGETKLFEGKEEEVQAAREIVLKFPFTAPPGKSYLDVVIVGKEGIGKSRKIFTIRG